MSQPLASTETIGDEVHRFVGQVQVFAGKLACPATPRERLRCFEQLLASAPTGTRVEQMISERLLTEALKRLRSTFCLAATGWDRPLSLSELAKEFAALQRTRHAASSRHLAKFCAIVQAQYRDRTLSEHRVARMLGISSSHLSRMLNRDSGRDFHWHLRSARLEGAKHLLVSTALRISTIASTCGFSTANEFNHQFKAAFGVTPTAYRDAHRPSAVYADARSRQMAAQE